MNINTLKATIVAQSEDQSHGIYSIKGLPTAVTHGLANLYRQAAYYLCMGCAPVGFKLLGVTKITDISPQFKESVRDIGVNISKIAFNSKNSDEEVKAFTLSYKGLVNSELTAGMLKCSSSEIEISNKDLKILTVSNKQEVDLEIEVLYSRGTLRASDQYKNNLQKIVSKSKSEQLIEKMSKDDFIRITANFSPIKLFRYEVIEDGNPDGRSELKFEIKTNGSIQARKVIVLINYWLSTINILMSSTGNFRVTELEDTGINWESDKVKSEDKKVSLADNMIEILDLDVETYNKLKEDYKINSLKELMKKVPELEESVRISIIKALEDVGLKVYEK